MTQYILEIPRLPSSDLSPNKLGGNRHQIGRARKKDKEEAYWSWIEKHPKVQRPFEKSHLHIAFVVGWITGPGFDEDNALARSKSFIDGIKKAEKLHQSKQWKQINTGLFTITYERKG